MWWFVMLVACVGGSGKSTGPQIPSGIQSIAPPPQSVEYVRINVAAPIELPSNRIREQWDGPHLQGDLITYDVTALDITSDDRGLRLTGDRHWISAEGYGYLGTFDVDGVFTPWEPKQVLLPPDPKIGDTWTGTHTKADSVSVRTCEILASDYCAGGIVSVCDSRKDGGVIVLRDHFCPGIGWGGFEALVQTNGNAPSIRMWSEELVKNGQPIPDPTPPESGG